MFLLDVNVLIAMAEPSHEHHDRAQQWFHSDPARVWATRPLTENAFVRILGHPNYARVYGALPVIRSMLERMCSFPGHQFWPDDLSLTDSKIFPTLAGSRHLTDLYLLALAVSRQGQLATLDGHIEPSIVPRGRQAYWLIPEK